MFDRAGRRAQNKKEDAGKAAAKQGNAQKKKRGVKKDRGVRIRTPRSQQT